MVVVEGTPEDRHDDDSLASCDIASAPMRPQWAARWTQVHRGDEPHAPAPRSAHAMTMITATNSILLHGGSNGKLFFDDFHLLEPTQLHEPQERLDAKRSASSSDHRRSRYSSRSRRGGNDTEETLDGGEDQEDTPPPPPLGLVWKKLVVSHSTANGATYAPSFLANSFGSDANSRSSGSPRGERGIMQDDPHLGAGRDYHTMHYVPAATREEEKKQGFRVLVVGNTLVSPASDDDEQTFDMVDMRIDEVRIKQNQRTAQWTLRKIQSMWKPHARQGHCSALVGDQLFCFGGRNATATVFYNDLFYYDVTLNQWREPPATGSPPSKRAVADMAASRNNEQLFVYGGRDAKQQFAGLFLYDVVANRWDKILASGDKPTARIYHSLTFATPHHLVLFAGRHRASRCSDTVLFDIKSRKWKQLTTATTAHCAGASSQGGDGQRSSQADEDDGDQPPSVRTTHRAVLYRQQQGQDPVETSHLLVFGGYAGSHTWLNDLHALRLDDSVLCVFPDDDRPPPPPTTSTTTTTAAAGAEYVGRVSTSSLSSSRELTTTRGSCSSPRSRTHSGLRTGGRSSSSSQNSNSSHDPRPSSRSSLENVLSDITNLAPPPATNESPAAASPAITTTSATARPSSSSASAASRAQAHAGGGEGYTPAAVAARKRRLAEMESKPLSSATRSSSSAKTRRQRTGSSAGEGATTASQTESQSQSQLSVSFSSGGGAGAAHRNSQQQQGSAGLNGADTTPSAIGLQTTMIQLLQHQQRTDESLARIASVVCNSSSHNGSHHQHQQHDALAAHQVFLLKQNDQLETKLDLMTRRYEQMEHKFLAMEQQKRALHEQLIAAETEVYVYKKNVEDLLPRIASQVTSAMEKASQAQSLSSFLLEAKISSIHDLLDDIRHATGDRTETDDASPNKKFGIFPDDCSPAAPTPSSNASATGTMTTATTTTPHAPAVLYPEVMVRELEHKLHDVVHENESLHRRVAVLEEKLKKADGNAQRIQELSMAWLRNQQEEEEEEEAKGGE